MLRRLKEKWNVDGIRLFLILCTFALGGSLCGYLGRLLLQLTGLEKGTLWVVLYILLVTILWPLCVLLISIPFGQFRFFTNYLRRIGQRLGIGKRNDGR